MLRRASGNGRPRLILVSAVVMMALVALAAVAVVAQRSDREASADESQAGERQGEEPQSKEPQSKEPPADLGIDLVHCPKAVPEELPPDALAGATEAALEQVPLVFGDVEANEGVYAVSASRGGDQVVTKGLGCSKLMRDRSVSVSLIFPKMLPSASLSQHTVFVARFRDEFWVWGTGH